MKTLQRFSGSNEGIPASTSWHIADLAEACGRQALLIRKSSSRLLGLRRKAILESAVSSNRIEDITGDWKHSSTNFLGKRLPSKNNEAALGYYRALELISAHDEGLPLSVDTLLRLHPLVCDETFDAGIPAEIEEEIEELIALWSHSLQERYVHPLLLLTAFNLDFLCLQPFPGGSGPLSRLLLLLQSCQLGYDVGRYISLERLIEQNRKRYHETLKESSLGWRDGSHNPWPYIDYLLFIFKTAYQELESHLNAAKSVRGEKTGQIEAAVKSFNGPFTFAELEKACLGTSHDMVRKVLRDLRDTGSVECLRRGPGARWQRKSNEFLQEQEAKGPDKGYERRNG